jgi:hypothetical protein
MNSKALIWLAGVAMTAVIGLLGTGLCWWVARVNDDHEIVKQLWWKDYYLNGPVSAAPVDSPKR